MRYSPGSDARLAAPDAEAAHGRRSFLVVAGAMCLYAGPALAPRGWHWAVAGPHPLEGTIADIAMAPPRPALRVKASDGVVWQGDVGKPRQTERSGFAGDAARVGVPIRVLGNRAKDRDKAHVKA